MPAANVGIPLTSQNRLRAALVPRFVEYFGNWLSEQKALGPGAHEALSYLEKLDPQSTATDTVNFTMGWFRPDFRPTPIAELADFLGGFSLAFSECSPIADGEFQRLSRLLGLLLITMLAESTGIITVTQDGTECGSFGLNPETTSRAPVEQRQARRLRDDIEEGSPRTERMLRALRDMRDLRARRQLRAAW
jgi:hypothetical protein